MNSDTRVQLSKISRTMFWVQLACLCVVLTQILTPNPAHAQESTAAINGRILDSSGGVIPEAQVVLTNVSTGVSRRTQTNTAGNYVFLNILPANYTLEVTKAGFRANKLEPFQLVVNQTATFNVTLEVGKVTEVVTVAATGARLETSTAELGATITSRSVVDLPLNGRNFTQLLTLTPGMSPVNVGQTKNNGGDQLAVGQFAFPAENGQTSRSNYFMIDGINNQGGFFNGYTVQPIVDAVQEFKVQSHNDQAQFGGVTGGIVNLVTKSGSNQLHGSLFEFLRNNAFDARNFFLAKVTPFKQNEFGVTAGGPVVLPHLYNGHNKTFFFLAYEGFRWRQVANTLYQVPTAADLQGNLSDVPYQLYNPFTTRADPNNPGKFIRDPFTNNQIPSTLLDKGILLYARTTILAPISTGVGTYNQLDDTPQKDAFDEYNARLDQNFGSKDAVWFRISGNVQRQITSAGRQNNRGEYDIYTKNYGGNWVHTFGPTSNLQVQVGRTTSYWDLLSYILGIPATFRTDVGFSDNFSANYIGGETVTPALNVTNYFTSSGVGHSIKEPTRITEEKATYSKMHGSHLLMTGFSLASNNYVEVDRGARAVFAAAQTGNPQNLGTTGSPLASFLLNVPDNALRQSANQTMRWGGVFGAFVQDQWKVTRRLTVNLGLRYDRTYVPRYGRPEDGNTAVGLLDLNTGTYIIQSTPPACSSTQNAPCIPGGTLPQYVVQSRDGSLYRPNKRNWSPRVGFAYRIGQRTAIRSSFGMFYDNWAGVTQYADNVASDWPSTGNLTTSSLNYPTAAQPTPSMTAYNPVPSSFQPAATPFQQSVYYLDPKSKTPYSMQWNFGVEQEFGSHTTVTLNYVGSGSRHLNLGSYGNTALTPGPGAVSARTPYPYINPTLYAWSWGKSSYQALQFMYNRRFSSGLSLVTSYTYSKSIDTGCSGYLGIEGCSVQDPYHFNNDRGPSAFDLTHVLTMSWLYELPFGACRRFKTGNRVVDYVVGPWQFNGITMIRPGPYYNVTAPGDISNTGHGGTYERANLVGVPKISNPVPSPGYWFNTTAFAAPASYTFGNFGRDVLRADYTRNFDLSVFRQFRLTESKRLEFRTEMFNAFNTPTFGAPTATFGNANFGKVTGMANTPRQIQFALKLLF
jgi:hypothetical protein